jgi:hypothetical protein
MPPSVSCCAVFELPNQLFAHAQGRVSPGGFIVATLPSFALSVSATHAEIGAAVVEALSAYTEALPNPFANRELARLHEIAVLKPIRLRSWSSIQRKAKLCHVERTATHIRVVPTRNAGWRGPERGFHELPEAAVVLAAEVTASELGAAVRSALSASTLPVPRPAA